MHHSRLAGYQLCCFAQLTVPGCVVRVFWLCFVQQHSTLSSAALLCWPARHAHASVHPAWVFHPPPRSLPLALAACLLALL